MGSSGSGPSGSGPLQDPEPSGSDPMDLRWGEIEVGRVSDGSGGIQTEGLDLTYTLIYTFTRARGREKTL